MVARLVAVANRARSSRSNSAAVRTRMPAALRRQRAASGKNGSCWWNLRELLLHHAADKHDGQHPLARFVGAHHVDHVAPSVLQAQGLEAQHAFDGAPVVLDRDLARAIERRGGLGERLIEKTEHGRLAAPLEREFMGGGLGGRRRAEEIAQRAEARRPVPGGEREAAPLFERGERFQLVEQALGAGARLAFVAEQQRAQFAQAGVGVCSRTSKSKRSAMAKSAKRGVRRRTARVRAWSQPPSMASMAPERKRTTAWRSSVVSK